MKRDLNLEGGARRPQAMQDLQNHDDNSGLEKSLRELVKIRDRNQCLRVLPAHAHA